MRGSAIHGVLSVEILAGEFGQVYKGYMKTKYKTDVVAVKTLRGTQYFHNYYYTNMKCSYPVIVFRQNIHKTIYQMICLMLQL